MEDIIIIAVIAVLVLIGIRQAVKHFRHEGGCCGGGSYKAKKKKLKNVLGKKTFSVADMTCQHCKNRVEEAVNSIEGAAGVVNLKKGIVEVSYNREIEEAVIISAIEKAGYKVTGRV